MSDFILDTLPAGWREPAAMLVGLISWIPAWQEQFLTMVWWTGETPAATFAARLLLFLPALLLVVALWTTMLSAYTLPFRSHRVGYMKLLVLTWWDAARSVGLFWAGIGRIAMVAVGWLWGLFRLAIGFAGRFGRQLLQSPFTALDWTARKYFKPGVPWLAFLLILGWSALETSIFTFTLRPTITGVLWDLTGSQPNPAFMTPILFMFLFLLISGSFACIQVLTESIDERKPKQIVQMLVVEVFVMFFEVVFLYRDLIDAVTPWIAQQTNEEVRLGLWSTLALASFGWLGIRGMTWFLFGRYGTPALLAILSRDTISLEGEGSQPASKPTAIPVAAGWANLIETFKEEREWFQLQGIKMLEVVVLPMLQLLGAAVNFPLIALGSQPAFSLPFDSLDEALAKMPSRRPALAQGKPAAETTRGG